VPVRSIFEKGSERVIMKIKREMLRFTIAGFATGATDFGIYYLLMPYMPFNLAKGISFVCAGIVAYLFNKYWIFACHQPSYAEIVRYVFINILSLGLNVYANQRILQEWRGAVFPALVLAAALTGAFTFVCYKWWVFRAIVQAGVSLVWWRWFPWQFLVKNAARRHGFVDPIKLLSQLQNFAQPSEVAAPTELVRSGVVLHARGLMNSLAIQHNLDWVWPYWVECQYNPRNEAFIPRSFSLTQINLTHRNWTALGVPDSEVYPLVDPRGLLTPYYDSWSVDVWIISEKGGPLLPSRCAQVEQRMILKEGLGVVTTLKQGPLDLQLKAQVIGSAQAPVCQMIITGASAAAARLVVALRPYNPEGVSFIHYIELLKDSPGWQVNRIDVVNIDTVPEQWLFSYYRHGDVYGSLSAESKETEIACKVGMASAAAVYSLKAGQAQTIMLSVPLGKKKYELPSVSADLAMARAGWENSLQGVCTLDIPDQQFQFLYESAITTMILHSPKEVYPGPYIYRRFWFRDAAFILNAMLCVGLKKRVRRALDCFRSRQTAQGYFLSQEGEWDSNGEALWIIHQYCEMTGSLPPKEWKDSILKAGMWIAKKRLSSALGLPHAGLLPSGFSAEHLGPNDFYYWDDFWGVAGLRAAAFLSAGYQDPDKQKMFEKESADFLISIKESLGVVEKRLKRRAIPASPYRRMDSGAIGSLAASYPLHIVGPDDQSVLDTAEFLMKSCLVHGGFFHDMTHSGINPYLTLHLAQVLLRAGDPRYFGLMTAVAKLASPTGQWPESVHPRTGGGCMGDGQHVWAAAEWVLMIRNCFVREEGDGLIFCSGIPSAWLEKREAMYFGPAPTRFGDVRIAIKFNKEKVHVEWSGQWHAQEPPIDVQFPGLAKVRILPGTGALGIHSLTKDPEAGVRVNGRGQ